MERVVELLSMPYMQMSFFNQLELFIHLTIITILCLVFFFGFRKAFKERQ